MKLTTREMVLVSLFTALTAIGAFMSIPVGEVPITLQSMFTLLAGALIGPKLGGLSQIIYILLGLLGVRIFSNFSGGPQHIFKPSFGFLMGFIFASYLVGKIIHERKYTSFNKIFFTLLLGTFVIYLFGIPYMYFILNYVAGTEISFVAAIKTGCLIFIPGDMLKAILSAFVTSKLVGRMNSNF